MDPIAPETPPGRRRCVPEATVFQLEAPVRFVDGQVVYGENGPGRGAWSYVRCPYNYALDQGVKTPSMVLQRECPMPVFPDAETGRLWFNPDWKALHMVASGDTVLGPLDTVLAHGLPLSTRLWPSDFGGGQSLIEMVVRQNQWDKPEAEEEHLLGWLAARPDERFGPSAAHPASLVIQCIRRGWLQAADALWERHGVRFTLKESEQGEPLTTLASLVWPNREVMKPSAATLDHLSVWRQRALETGSAHHQGRGPLAPPKFVLDLLMERVADANPNRPDRHRPEDACQTPEDWTRYLKGWVDDLTAAGVSRPLLVLWARRWASAPSLEEARRPVLQTVKAVMAAISLEHTTGKAAPRVRPRI